MGEDFEFDILTYNGDIVVVVEVKTTLWPDEVNERQAEENRRVEMVIY